MPCREEASASSNGRPLPRYDYQLYGSAAFLKAEFDLDPFFALD
jgi:hypothetical protein